MDEKFIKNAADLFRSLDLSELQIRDGDAEILMKRKSPCNVSLSAAATLKNKAEARPADEEFAELPDASADFREVKAPLLGIFHLTPAPGREPYVKIGDEVKAGSVLCIIEAMKTMNEIKACENGVIADICAEAGKAVEYGQTLFKLSSKV